MTCNPGYRGLRYSHYEGGGGNTHVTKIIESKLVIPQPSRRRYLLLHFSRFRDLLKREKRERGGEARPVSERSKFHYQVFDRTNKIDEASLKKIQV